MIFCRREFCSIAQLGACNFLFRMTRKVTDGGRGALALADSNALGKMDIKWRSPMGEVRPLKLPLLYRFYHSITLMRVHVSQTRCIRVVEEGEDEGSILRPGGIISFVLV